MRASNKEAKLYKALLRYRTKYLNKNLEQLDESSTRILINHLLSDVLGYRELTDIKIEYPITGGYIDYLIEINNKKIFVIEAKSIKTKLTNKHLRQAFYYGAMVGSNWVILTNGRYLELHKIIYTKPIKIIKVFTLDFRKIDKDQRKLTSLITKKSVINGTLKSTL